MIYAKADGDFLVQEDCSGTIQQIHFNDDGDELSEHFSSHTIATTIKKKKHTRINIFEAVLEQEAEY
jgi:hypothetical protein